MTAPDRYRGKTVAVSGASGYIASSIVEDLLTVGATVLRMSRRPMAPLSGCTDIVCDYADRTPWDRIVRESDTVIHLAAQTSFYRAAEDPDADFQANVTPMRCLLEACRRHKLSPFIVYAGSTTQAGIPVRSPVDESHLDLPITFYDMHKLASEKLLEGYARQGLARGATLRLCNVFGPGPRSSASDRGILNASILRALRGERLVVYGDGSPIRDFLYIKDVAAAFLAAGIGGDALNGRHFVMGSGRGVSLLESFRIVSERVRARTGRVVEISSVPEPAGHSPIESRRFIGDSAAFRAAADWSPTVALEAGIDKTIEFAALPQGVA